MTLQRTGDDGVVCRAQDDREVARLQPPRGGEVGRLGTAVLDRPRFLTPGRHSGPATEPAGAVDPYNLWMITTTAEALAASLPETAATIHLPDGLTVDDALRIAEAVASTLAESTRHVYGHGWRQWGRWCSARQTVSLPASPAMICAYLTERASEGALVPTLDLAIGAISYAHRSRGRDDPTRTEAVRQVRRGLRRIVGAAPRRQARPLDTGDIRQILGPIDRTTAKGARDAAIILLGFASALRRSELAALDLIDVEPKPGGLLLHVRRSKTDQDAAGQVVAVAHGQHADTDPIAGLDGWLGQRGRERGPLFTSMRNKTVTDERLSGNAIARMLRNRAERWPSGRANHPALSTRRARDHRRRRRGELGPDRCADPAQAALHIAGPLHPSRPGAGPDL